MQRKKTLQIGSSDFKGFIESNGYFVDKTLLIQELIDTHYKVLLIPRPRRFGKSINLSMLKHYFDAGAQDNSKLFESKQLKKDATPARIQTELSKALGQITKNKYYKELVAHKVHNRIEMAMVFVGKEVYLEVN